MARPPSAFLLVSGLLTSLGVAYLLACWLAADPPRPRPAVARAEAAGPEPGAGGAAAGAAAPAGKPRKAGAYEVIEVKDGGTIRVFCKLSRAAPAQTIPFNKNQAQCGHESMPNERCVFDPATLGLANCIVGLTDIAKGKAFEGEMAEKGRTIVLDQKGCRYVPHVMLARAGSRVAVKNSDPAEHNVRCFFMGKADLVFNQMSSSNSYTEPTEQNLLARPGTYPLYCDIHYWMTGYIRTVSHPYHAVSAEDGRATLTNVPPGQYRIGCWHEGMRVTLLQNGAEISGYEFSPDIVLPEQVVDVPAGGTVDVTFVLDPL